MTLTPLFKTASHARHGLLLLWVLGLALTLFTLSHPDCVDGTAPVVAWEATAPDTLADPTAGTATAMSPRAGVHRLTCALPHSSRVAAAMDSALDLPDFDLGPRHALPPAPHVRHAWVATVPLTPDRAPLQTLQRPPDARRA